MGAWSDSAWRGWYVKAWSTDTAPPTDITDILISRSSVRVTAGLNAVVGSLSAVGGAGAATFSLVAGTGDTDNADFSIDGNVLRCDDPATLGVGSYSVRIEADDGLSTYDKQFSITVYQPASAGAFGLAVGLTRPLSRALTRNLAG